MHHFFFYLCHKLGKISFPKPWKPRPDSTYFAFISEVVGPNELLQPGEPAFKGDMAVGLEQETSGNEKVEGAINRHLSLTWMSSLPLTLSPLPTLLSLPLALQSVKNISSGED